MSRVAIVLDARFADRVAVLAQAGPVWATKAANAQRSGRVTVFADEPEPGADLAYLIEEVLLHHGPASGGLDLDEIEVLGSDATDAARIALGDHGFDEIRRTADGFVACRPG
jgi:hypothetical protein